ncbi:hypothetical protein KSF_106780 [Reticulibacter mediterranei]|uniref:Uncharacterized protein n=1 Tax=Reticulibacter mediterranei TaxID=2778369 RepID=A0A8J3N9I5_9CHLR|nr:hypothetical protein [Reticulibacter mediterranei]GHP00631.1 hypothetical protein KSF_106780 [Reticulibacter mediterranei]
MIAVDLERQGLQGHSYCAHGEIAGSTELWYLLKEPALAFLHCLKYEYPHLEFQVRIRVRPSYINDGFVPEVALTLLSSNDGTLAASLLQQFVAAHAHLVTGEEEGG